jgi:hypothetical protein|mmetsp:Transcript_260/g.441  ORF Transcript_260/g.441 Transcript_260/m.441 type:complete len:214 (-) Transcript_260:675-1316(-)
MVLLEALFHNDDVLHLINHKTNVPLEGYEANFLVPPREELFCPICTQVAREATVTEDCGHLFCKSCIEVALENKPECPVCRLPLSSNGIRKDVRTRREIAGLRVQCPFVNKGCKWTGSLGELADHEDHVCEFTVVKCPNKHCGLFMQRCMLDIHMCLSYVEKEIHTDDELEERERAALSLQAFYRGQKARWQFMELREETTVLDSLEQMQYWK